MKKTNNVILSILLLGIGLLTGSCQSSEDGEARQPQQTDEETQVNELTDTEKEEGWKLLFNGGDPREQWRGYCKEDFPRSGWTVENGALKVQGSGAGEAGGGGTIVTRETYRDFELQLEWKVEKGGNSGIFYLVEEQCGEEQGEPIWKSAPEMQILDNDHHPDARLGEDGNRQAGALYDMMPASPQNAEPYGTWNKVRILVYQGTVVHFQNGEQILEYHLWTDQWEEMIASSKFAGIPEFIQMSSEGYIGLQDHGNDVWFRNIKIKNLTTN